LGLSFIARCRPTWTPRTGRGRSRLACARRDASLADVIGQGVGRRLDRLRGPGSGSRAITRPTVDRSSTSPGFAVFPVFIARGLRRGLAVLDSGTHRTEAWAESSAFLDRSRGGGAPVYSLAHCTPAQRGLVLVRQMAPTRYRAPLVGCAAEAPGRGAALEGSTKKSRRAGVDSGITRSTTPNKNARGGRSPRCLHRSWNRCEVAAVHAAGNHPFAGSGRRRLSADQAKHPTPPRRHVRNSGARPDDLRPSSTVERRRPLRELLRDVARQPQW